MIALEPALPGAAEPTSYDAVAVPGACIHTAECIFPVVVPAARLPLNFWQVMAA